MCPALKSEHRSGNIGRMMMVGTWVMIIYFRVFLLKGKWSSLEVNKTDENISITLQVEWISWLEKHIFHPTAEKNEPFGGAVVTLVVLAQAVQPQRLGWKYINQLVDLKVANFRCLELFGSDHCLNSCFFSTGITEKNPWYPLRSGECWNGQLMCVSFVQIGCWRSPIWKCAHNTPTDSHSKSWFP